MIESLERSISKRIISVITRIYFKDVPHVPLRPIVTYTPYNICRFKRHDVSDPKIRKNLCI